MTTVLVRAPLDSDAFALTSRSSPRPRILVACPKRSRFPTVLRAAILAWFRSNGRPLAFRRTRDPYAVLVSEAMAQQTQAARAAEAWERFMVRFPAVGDLAAAVAGRRRPGLAGSRIRPSSAESLASRGSHRRAPRRARPGRPGGPRSAPGGRPVHGQGGPGPGLRGSGRGRRHERPPGARAHRRRRRAHIDPGGHAGLADEAVPDSGTRRLDARLDWVLRRPVRRARRLRRRLRPWCRSAGVDAPFRVPPHRRSTGPRAPAIPFSGTNRWLRGRILDRLRAAPGASWVEVDARIGTHDDRAVTDALGALARDGMIQFEPPGRARLRGA